MADEKIKKVSIVCSKGSLEGIYPALIMANGARMEGIEVNLFFTFFGMDAITKKKDKKDQGRYRGQSCHGHTDHHRRTARHVRHCHQDDAEKDGRARYPAHRRIHRDDQCGRRQSSMPARPA